MESLTQDVERKILAAERLWLFLDYDGTLAEFAPTPDVITPNDEIIRLVRGFTDNPLVRVSIISGRRLAHVHRLVPVEGIWLAGTYGLEYLQPDGSRGNQIAYEEIRPTLEEIKPEIETLLSGKAGFYLEDKGWTLAIHARFADEEPSVDVLKTAKAIMAAKGDPDRFRIMGGHRFLEIGPKAANKGETVAWLLQSHAFHGSVPVYLGDDDKDEEAFAIVQQHGGLAIVVSAKTRPTLANARLPTPQAAREWLHTVLDRFNQRAETSKKFDR